MTDSRLAALTTRLSVRRVVGGVIGAAIGFVVVLWLIDSILLAVLLGCGLGFLIGMRVATGRGWRGGDRPDSLYHAPLGKVGRGGGGDMEGPGM